ncbi:MAG: integral rane protein [Gammaproteobacteria bacterium]|jgi:YggT family protein|nr:integral rane protein [Gammaproteobacteria bacterium]
MLIEAGSFLIGILFDFYLTVLLLRFLLQWIGANYYNPISQFTVKLTDPILKPLRKLIPNRAGIDIAILVTLLVMAVIKNGLLIWLQNQTLPYIVGLILLAIANLLALTCSIFFYTILIRVILSWITPAGYNPALEIIQRITEPLLAPARRYIPPISGIDLSPLIVIILLEFINLFFIRYLIAWSEGLAILG